MIVTADDIECTFTPRPVVPFQQPSNPYFPPSPGQHPLQMGGKKDGFIVVPQTYSPSKPAAMIMCLHGATGTPEHQYSLYKRIPETENVILVVRIREAFVGIFSFAILLVFDRTLARFARSYKIPSSRIYTWDLIASRGEAYGDDISFLQHVLFRVFQSYHIAPHLVAIAGFSDGASYAASLAISNGELFRTLLANSPGFAAPLTSVGRPRAFLSHGTNDKVLPIAHCSRRLVPLLTKNGYDVEYIEFEGGHEVPQRIVDKMVDFFLRGKKSPDAVKL